MGGGVLLIVCQRHYPVMLWTLYNKAQNTGKTPVKNTFGKFLHIMSYFYSVFNAKTDFKDKYFVQTTQRVNPMMVNYLFHSLHIWCISPTHESHQTQDRKALWNWCWTCKSKNRTVLKLSWWDLERGVVTLLKCPCNKTLFCR